MNISQSRNAFLFNSMESCPSGRIESIGSSSGSSGESLRGERSLSLSLSQRSVDMVSSEMTPEQKLAQCNSRVQDFADSEQFDACIQETVRLVALSRLVYGDGHLKQAQAYARLAKAYLKFKGWAAQADEHASRAHSLLPLSVPSSTPQEERVARLHCLLSTQQTQGGAALLLGNLMEAESFFIKAEGILGELQELSGVSPEESTKTEFEISTNLSRVYQRQGRSGEALAQCQRALELQEEMGEAGRSCSIHRDMAAIEQARGRLDKAIEHLLQAHAIALSQSPEGMEGAHVAHSLALAYSSAAEPHHNDSAAHYFEESLSVYRSVTGPEDATTLTVLDDYCRFLLQTGQQERSVALQRESLALKRSAFGDLSTEVAETLQLIGGVEMTQGQMKQAHKTMSKCLEVQIALFGPRHKKTRATQRTVNMLSQVPEVSAVHRREGSLQTRPPFCAVVPSPTAKGINTNMSDP
ncbi:tetratricopeptide repeat protein 23 [Alosa sapidissima]|uniref:tetratricopeptide repeat protein 23 n=1 Tax=Alosa sapidissima TaxID=34773 RepID=UPI001C098E08|nr:tetratricopeptide repeat protein 23 [Alosa sapidissima]